MAKRTGDHGERRLSEAKIARLKEPGFYADGASLYLKVDAKGSKRWVQRVTLAGGPRIDIGMGSYDPTTIDRVRIEAIANREQAKRGTDPRKVGRSEAPAVPTFQELARIVHDIRRKEFENAKHTEQWISTLQTYAFPFIGQMRVDQVAPTDIVRVLSPIWSSKRETASRVKQRMKAVLSYAIEHGYRKDANPVLDRFSTLAVKRDAGGEVRHQPAVHHARIGEALAMITDATRAWTATKLCIEFIVLTGVRSGEARKAVWSEIDIAKKVWAIPAERLKMRRPHRVPLSSRALEILAEARGLSDGTGLLFPSRQGVDKPLSDNTLSKLLRERGVPSIIEGQSAVVHGFRATLRMWLADCRPDVPASVAEQVLAHEDRSKVVRAYQRSDLFEQRVALMQDWCDFIKARSVPSSVAL